MRLLLLALGAWTAWKIAQENGLAERSGPAPIKALPRRKIESLAPPSASKNG